MAERSLVVGDGQIDGTLLKAYRLSWRQCTFEDGDWKSQASLTEELKIVNTTLVHSLAVAAADGVTQVTTTTYDRGSLAPLHMEHEVTREGASLAYETRTLTADGYTGTVTRDEESQNVAGTINSAMLNGAAMGLPLATLPLQDEPLTFRASMMSFDGTYNVTAAWAGTETIEFMGTEIEAWLVDVEWHHIESGDVYQPGPNGSGGRFWIVRNPPSGFPYVPKYQTDTYAVEYVADRCTE